VNYRTTLGRLAVALNQAVYATRLDRPLVATEDGSVLTFESADGRVLARGSETTARLSMGDLSLFLGYVYVEVDRETGGQTVPLPLTARHRTYTVLVWERHGESRIGLEAYWTGPQRLPGGGESPGFVVTGIMAQKRIGAVRVFANLENLLDTRQSRTSPLVTGPRSSPVYAPVWGPTDGFIANAGFILDL
jgi:iron complex outermembrane receptor protein